MPLFKMTLYKMPLFKMTLYKMPLSKMTLYWMSFFKMTLDKIPLFKMTQDKIPLFIITQDKMSLIKMTLYKMPFIRMILWKMPLFKMTLFKMPCPQNMWWSFAAQKNGNKDGIKIEIVAPFYNDPAPIGSDGSTGSSGGSFFQLWDYEVVEAFFLSTPTKAIIWLFKMCLQVRFWSAISQRFLAIEIRLEHRPISWV